MRKAENWHESGTRARRRPDAKFTKNRYREMSLRISSLPGPARYNPHHAIARASHGLGGIHLCRALIFDVCNLHPSVGGLRSAVRKCELQRVSFRDTRRAIKYGHAEARIGEAYAPRIANREPKTRLARSLAGYRINRVSISNSRSSGSRTDRFANGGIGRERGYRSSVSIN